MPLAPGIGGTKQVGCAQLRDGSGDTQHSPVGPGTSYGPPYGATFVPVQNLKVEEDELC